MNTEKLRNRLALIDHYKYRYGAQHTYWVHYALRNVARNCWTYKFNYLAKGALAYLTYRQIAAYNHAETESFLTEGQRTQHRLSTLAAAGAFVGTSLIV